MIPDIDGLDSWKVYEIKELVEKVVELLKEDAQSKSIDLSRLSASVIRNDYYLDSLIYLNTLKSNILTVAFKGLSGHKNIKAIFKLHDKDFIDELKLIKWNQYE